MLTAPRRLAARQSQREANLPGANLAPMPSPAMSLLAQASCFPPLPQPPSPVLPNTSYPS